MKVALIADAEWLMHEQTTLRRLVVGLVDESVRVLRIAPDLHHEQTEQLLITCEQLWYRPHHWEWMRDRQLRALAEAIREAGVDVIHALDGSLQSAAVRLARELEIPMVCSVWSEAEAGRLRTHEEGVNGAYAAASRGLMELVRNRVGGGPPVVCIPPGVYTSAGGELAPPLVRPAESLGCTVIGNGRLDGHYQALLEAIARTRDDLPAAMYFFFTIGADQHRLWQAVEAMDLLDEVTLVPTGTETRQMLMRADVLVQPQPLRTVRTVVLEAMAASRPVLAAADPMVDHLIDNRTARVVGNADAEQWATCLRQLAGGPQTFVKLGQSARQYVLEQHKASAFVTALRQLYEQVATPQAIPFSEA